MPHKENRKAPETQIFMIAIGGTALIGAAAYGLGFLLDAPLGPQIKVTTGGTLAGLLGVLPLAGFLWWFAGSSHPVIERFRRSQIKFFAEIGFEFTLGRIVLMATAAGIAEELMFRGVMQTWMAGVAPLAVAIVAPNLLFGLLHMRTVLYAIIAGLVGVYLGVLLAATDNLLVPMIAHGGYDLIALEYTRRAIRRHRETVQEQTDSNTGI